MSGSGVSKGIRGVMRVSRGIRGVSRGIRIAGTGKEEEKEEEQTILS